MLRGHALSQRVVDGRQAGWTQQVRQVAWHKFLTCGHLRGSLPCREAAGQSARSGGRCKAWRAGRRRGRRGPQGPCSAAFPLYTTCMAGTTHHVSHHGHPHRLGAQRDTQWHKHGDSDIFSFPSNFLENGVVFSMHQACWRPRMQLLEAENTTGGCRSSGAQPGARLCWARSCTAIMAALAVVVSTICASSRHTRHQRSRVSGVGSTCSQQPQPSGLRTSTQERSWREKREERIRRW